MEEINRRVISYWTARAHDFASVRKNELKNSITGRWLDEFGKFFSNDTPLDILDVGTGSGYFAILLSKLGHRVTGIDLTESMLIEAAEAARECEAEPVFLHMDAQALNFEDNSFDVVVTRNLTWTLPQPEKAYSEWYRVLKPGGILLNFDADYAQNVRNNNQKLSYINPSDIYGHIGMTKELDKENTELTLMMPAGSNSRPAWDIMLMRRAGFESVDCDTQIGKMILLEHDLPDAPMFRLYGRK